MSKEDKPKIGRPVKYDPALMAEVCERISKGEPLAQICRSEHMPGPTTVYKWMLVDTNLSEDFARARARGFDFIAEECLEIADDATNDYMDKRAKEGDERAAESVLNGEHVQRSKLRIETRLKLLAKWDPKRYGDKITQEVTGVDGGPVNHSFKVEFIKHE